MKRRTKKLRKVGRQIRKDAPPLPGDRMMPDPKAPEAAKPNKPVVTISKRELEAMKQGLSTLVQCGALNSLATGCLVHAMSSNEDEKNRARMFRVAEVLTDDPEVRCMALMLHARTIRQQFAQHQHDPRRLRPLIAEALQLVEQADVAAKWVPSDLTLSEWTGLVLRDLKQRQRGVGEDPNAMDEAPADETSEDAGEPAEDAEVDEQADPDADESASPGVIEFE